MSKEEVGGLPDQVTQSALDFIIQVHCLIPNFIRQLLKIGYNSSSLEYVLVDGVRYEVTHRHLSERDTWSL